MAQMRPLIELHDVSREVATFLTTFFATGPADNESEPLLIPASRSDVEWDGYESFLAATSERSLRHSYANHTLELMSPRVCERENTKAVLRRFTQSLTLKMKQLVVSLGAATLASPSRQLGIEPDEAFCFARRVELKPGLFFDVDRADSPELVIEVGQLNEDHVESRVSAVEVHRLGLLARLEVPEIWAVNRGIVQIVRVKDGKTVTSDHSHLLPSVTSQMLTRHLRNRLKIGENACVRDFVHDALRN